MNVIAGLLQIVGFIMLFTPLFIIGIICIVIGGFIFFTTDKVDDAISKRDTKKHKEHASKTNKEFKKNFSMDPLSEDTETAFNKLSYSDKLSKSFSNHTLEDKFRDTTYRERVEIALDRFEKSYIAKGEESLRDKLEMDENLLGSPEKYRQTCQYLNRKPIPELVEDFVERERYEKWKENREQEQLDERVLFIKNGIQKLTSENKSRKYIQGAVQSDYRQKFEEEVELRSINGSWTAKKILYSRQPIELGVFTE